MLKWYKVHLPDGVNVAHAVNAQAARDSYREEYGRVKVTKCPKWALKVYRQRGTPFYEVFALIVR